MSPFRSLLWKEYRQYRSLAIGLVVICLLIQLVGCLFNWNELHYRYSPLMISLNLTVLYIGVYCTVTFVKEKEEKTFFVLRYAPIRSIDILKAKLMWLFLSALSVACIGLFSAALLALVFIPAESSLLDGIVLLCTSVFIGICWGTFCSVHSKTTASALLGICFGVVFNHILAGFLAEWLLRDFQRNNHFLNEYNSAFPFQLLIALPFGIIGLYKAFHWLDGEIIPRSWSMRTNENVIGQTGDINPRFLKRPKSEFRSLIWHAAVQSKTLLCWMILPFILLLTMPFIIMFIDSMSNLETRRSMNTVTIFIALGSLITIVIFCANVFAGDQRNNQATVLAQRGVGPGKIWSSRILLFGGIYFALYLIVVVYGLVLGNLHRDAAYIFWIIPGNFFAPFCIGQLLSLFFRSTILTLCGTFFVWVLFITWFFIMVYGLGLSPFWTTVPLLIGCLVASRLYCPDWLRGQTVFQARKRVWFALFLPVLAVLFATPFVRMYSVPTIDLGYRTTRILFRGTPDIVKKERQLFEQPGGYQTIRSLKYQQEYWLAAQNVYRTPGFYDALPDPRFRGLWEATYMTDRNPEELREFLQFLQEMPKYRAPSREWVARAYEQQKFAIATRKNKDDRNNNNRFNETWIGDNTPPFFFKLFMSLPWERTRLLKRVDNAYQGLSNLADRTDAAIFHNSGEDFRSLRHNYLSFFENEVGWYTYYNSDETYKHPRGKNMLDQVLDITNYLFFDLDPGHMYNSELWRRALIITTALQLWYLEHGELPETLDQLVGTYLEELPRAPVYDIPFDYVREWKKEGDKGYYDEGDNSRRRENAPHLSLTRQGPTKYWEQDAFSSTPNISTYPLEFLLILQEPGK